MYNPYYKTDFMSYIYIIIYSAIFGKSLDNLGYYYYQKMFGSYHLKLSNLILFSRNVNKNIGRDFKFYFILYY